MLIFSMYICIPFQLHFASPFPPTPNLQPKQISVALTTIAHIVVITRSIPGRTTSPGFTEKSPDKWLVATLDGLSCHCKCASSSVVHKYVILRMK